MSWRNEAAGWSWSGGGVGLALLVSFLAVAGARAQEPAPEAGAEDAVAEAWVEEGFVAADDGTRLFYRAIGEGEEVAVVPVGFYLEDALERLARPGRRLVFYDPRGRGRSDPVDSTRISLDHQVADLEALRRGLGIERMALIGWSGLGMEMAVYALRHPRRVTRLVQVAPVPPSLEPHSAEAYEERARRFAEHGLGELVERQEAGEFEGAPAAYCRAQNAVVLPALVADSSSLADMPDVCVHPYEHPENLGPFFRALLASFGSYDWRDELSGSSVPRLVIHGEEDAFPVEGSRDWVRGFPEARLLVLADADHFPFLDRPDAFFAAVERFLAGRWPEGAVGLE